MQKTKRPKTKTSYELPPKLKTKWMKKDEAMVELACSRQTIERMVADGRLVGDHYNGLAMISRESVAAYLRQWTAE
jgi:hypothetical protein